MSYITIHSSGPSEIMTYLEQFVSHEYKFMMWKLKYTWYDCGRIKAVTMLFCSMVMKMDNTVMHLTPIIITLHEISEVM